MGVVHEIAKAIQRNPKINRVIVSASELEVIRDELEDMSFVRPGPRPAYGGIDAKLWDEMMAQRKKASIRIMDRPVEARA